jgi:drug/metabolite transporter (DMT)-like permease
LLLLKALKYIDAEKAATLSVLEPVFVLIFGIILLDEKITFIQTIGTIIVLLGALMVLFHTTAKTKY